MMVDDTIDVHVQQTHCWLGDAGRQAGRPPHMVPGSDPALRIQMLNYEKIYYYLPQPARHAVSQHWSDFLNTCNDDYDYERIFWVGIKRQRYKYTC